jgi:hypothetical protein
MALRRGRFDHLSHREAIAMMKELEGPLLELELSLESCAGASALVFNGVS